MCKENAVLGRFFAWRIGNYFRNVVNCFRKGVNLFRKAILTNSTVCRQGVLSVFSRSSVGKIREGIREGKERAILTKVLFFGREMVGSS